MPDVFDQIHATTPAPSGGRDVFDQIHSDQQQPEDAGFWSTLFHDVSNGAANAPKRIMDFLSGHPVDDVKQAMRDSYAARQVHKQRAVDAYNAGDYKTAADQAFFGNVPFLGPALGAVADEHKTAPGQASAHALEILGPALLDPAMETASDIAGSRLGVATGGAIKGTAQAAIAPAKIRYLKTEIPFGNLAAGTMAGHYAGRAIGTLFGAPAEGAAVGTALGAGGVLIKGALQGARKALADKFGVEEAPTVAPAAGRIPPIVPAKTPAPAGKTPAEIAREEIQTQAPAPEPFEVEGTPTKEGIAQGQYNKSYGQLNADQRNIVDNLAEKFNSAAKPAGPQLVPPRVNQGNPPSGQDIIRGSSNIPLSEQGAAEAQRLAQATAGQFDKIYTSPLDRAQATAKAVASTNPQAGAPEPTEALTPWYLGAHEGQPTTTVLSKMQDLIQNKPDEVPAGRGPQSTKPGQSFNDFKDEFLGHVKDQVENYEPGQKILNATHYRDTRVLQAWAKAGASADNKIDVPTMLEKGDVKPGDLLHLNPQTMEVKAVPDAAEPGIYFARHGATAWNAENGTPNPAESVGAPGPAGGGPSQVQPPAAELARLNAGAPPEAAPAGGGMFLRNFDLDKIARTIRTQLNKGAISKEQAQQIMESRGGVETLRDQLGLKGRYEPAMSDYLARRVDLTQPEQGQAVSPTIQQVISSRLQGWPGVKPTATSSPIGTTLNLPPEQPATVPATTLAEPAPTPTIVRRPKTVRTANALAQAPTEPTTSNPASSVEFGKEGTEGGKKTFTVRGILADGSPSGDFVKVRQNSVNNSLYEVTRQRYETPPGPDNRYGRQVTDSIGGRYTKAEAKQVAEAFLKGQPNPFADIESGLPMDQYKPGSGQFPKEYESRLSTGYPHAQVGDQHFWSDGHVMFDNVAPGPVGKEIDMSRVLNDAKADATVPMEPIGFYRNNGITTVVLKGSDGTPVLLDRKFFDYARKNYKDVSFAGKDSKSGVSVFSGDKHVGVMMPMRLDDPRGIGLPKGIQVLLKK